MEANTFVSGPRNTHTLSDQAPRQYRSGGTCCGRSEHIDVLRVGMSRFRSAEEFKCLTGSFHDVIMWINWTPSVTGRFRQGAFVSAGACKRVTDGMLIESGQEVADQVPDDL